MTKQINWTLRGTIAALVVALGASAGANEQGQQKQQSMQDQSARGQAAQEQKTKQQNQRTAQNQQQQSPALVIGTVAEIRNVNVQGGDGQSSSHRLVKVQRQDGKNVVVDAGVVSGSALQGLSAGDRIIAVGRAGRINDEPVVFARTMGELYTTGSVSSGGNKNKAGSNERSSASTTGSSAQQRQGDRQMTASSGAKQTEQTTGSPHGQIAAKAGQPINVLAIGEIVAARDVSLAETAGDRHRLVQIETKQGQKAVVDLGVPQGELKQANLTKGDRIVALGKPARINGRPVLFAASVAELQSVGKTAGRSTEPTGQTSAKQSGNQARSDEYATVVYLFETDNLLEDDYGMYDEDFVWITEDPVYGQWSTADGSSLAWENREQAHYDMFGYDDAGEQGLWDW